MDYINTLKAFEVIAETIGAGIFDLSFQLELENGTIKISADRFDLSALTDDKGKIVFRGRWRDISIVWEFKPWMEGYLVKLGVIGDNPLRCTSVKSLIIKYKHYSDDMKEWWIPTIGEWVDNIGLVRTSDLNDANRRGVLFRGVFSDSTSDGLFLGTFLPQSNIHQYNVEHTSEGELCFTCETEFLESHAEKSEVISEITWVSARKSIAKAIEDYSSHLPSLKTGKKPLCGWNSWDYYFRAVSMDDIVENMNEIKNDPVLSNRIKYIIIDDGWSHVEGEWYSNYRFPEGMKKAADDIKENGFIPGIWTSPLLVHYLSKTAMRMHEILVKDKYGDPEVVEGYYLVDPTSPKGKEFLKDIFTRLYNYGFRVFKVDFVSYLQKVKWFYDREKGVYDAIRDLFSIIRGCVGHESHIIGCSLPPECGAGVADSGRIGVDIHNQWTHVEWAFDYLQLQYWMNNRIWTNDVDFLIVRGKDTSLEQDTNVLNPQENNPNPPRWRRGPVFTINEARTWASIVLLSGGSIILGDRLSMLNDQGKNILRCSIDSTGISAKPLDLCEDRYASLWLMELEHEYRLTIINWFDKTKRGLFDFAKYNLVIPDIVTDFWTGYEYCIDNDTLCYEILPHASMVVTWKKR